MKYLLFLTCFISFSASAAMTSPYQPIAVSQTIKNVGSHTMTTQMTGKTAANASTYAMRNVTVTNSALAQTLKAVAKFPFTPLGVALITAGLILDDLGQWTSPTTGTTGLGSCTNTYSGGGWTNMTFADCYAQAQTILSNSVFSNGYDLKVTVIPQISKKRAYITTDPNGSAIAEYNSPTNIDNVDLMGTVPQSATDQDFIDAFDSLSPWEQNNALIDPATGLFVNPSPMDSAAADLTSDHNANTDTDPLTNPTTDSSGDTGTASESSEPNQATEQAKNPSQCDLLPDSLSCQEFGDELTPDDIITQTPNFDYSPVSISSDNSCPAPANISLTNGGSFEFSYQPICDFGGLLSYLIIAIATFTGAYILIGGVKN